MAPVDGNLSVLSREIGEEQYSVVGWMVMGAPREREGVGLQSAKKDARWRAMARPTEMSSSVRMTPGERLASGWGRVVFRSG